MPTFEELLKKSKKQKVVWPKYRPTPSGGGVSLHLVKRPTLAVMTKEQARTFKATGWRISRTFYPVAETSLSETLQQAIRAIKARRINLLVNGLCHTVEVPRQYRKGRVIKPDLRVRRRMQYGHKGGGHLDGPVNMSMDFDVEKDTDSDGTPVVVIITPTVEMPVFKVRHEVRPKVEKDEKERRKGPTPPNGEHLYLKAPLTDDLLIEALKKAGEDLLGTDYVGTVKWKENLSRQERAIGDHHLLVCLFFYVYFHQLYADSRFYGVQRKSFYEFCTSRMGEGHTFNKLRSFQKTVNLLQVRKLSFENYYKAASKDDDGYEKDKPSLPMWYKLYLMAADSFEKVLMPRAKA